MRNKLWEIVRERCACNISYYYLYDEDYNYSESAIHSGGFSCPAASCQQSNCSLITHATYRATIRGRSDKFTANQLMDILKEWHDSSSSLLVDSLRLQVARSKECQLSIGSFDEKTC